MPKVVIWDVQHGSAAHIRTPNGKHIAVDLGCGSHGWGGSAFSPLLYLRDRYHVAQLDGVVVTHPHTDHLSDIVNFDALSPIVLWRPRHLREEEIRADNQERDSSVIDKYIAIDSRYTGTVSMPEDVFLSENNGGADIQVFWPRSCPHSNLNDQSGVVVISYAGCKMLLPGDNEPPSWNELLGQVGFRTAIVGTHVLVAPHHGRDSGYASALFQWISPLLVVISDGHVSDTSATNRYSRVAKGWNVRSRSRGDAQRKCLTTRSDGVIVVSFWGDQGRPCMDVEVD